MRSDNERLESEEIVESKLKQIKEIKNTRLCLRLDALGGHYF